MMRRVALFFVCFVLLFGFMGCMEPEITMFNVSFIGNGADSGSVPSMVSVKEGDLCTIPISGSLSKTGYDFKWWNTEPDGSGISYKASQSFKPNGDTTLFAQWEIHSYSISYDLSDGILPEGRNNPFQYTVETDTFTLANPVRDGYKFVGWFDGVETSKDLSIQKGTTGNKSFVAVWRLLNSYEISYDSNGGEGSIESKYRFENEAVEILQPTNIKKEGFEFNCWNTKADGSGTTYQAGDSYNENQDLKLYAQWSIIRYSISYDLEGGILSVSNPSEYTIESALFTLNNPTKEGFVFLGWKFKGAPNEDASKDVSVKNGTTGDLSFVAVWRPLNSYSISYNVNGGEGTVSTAYKYEGKPITIANASAISKKGYSFVCWNTRADGTGTVYNPDDTYKDDENLQLYAQWSIIDYTIEYNLNDGELPVGMSNPSKYTVETADIILVNPTRYGHEFVGWRYKDDSDASSSKNFVIAKGSVGNLWIPIPSRMI